jgi:hypothetical protein
MNQENTRARGDSNFVLLLLLSSAALLIASTLFLWRANRVSEAVVDDIGFIEIELSLVLHPSTQDPVAREWIEKNLSTQMKEAYRGADSEEELWLLAEVEVVLNRYLRSSHEALSPDERAELLAAAYRAVEKVRQIHLAQVPALLEKAERLRALSTATGLGATILLALLGVLYGYVLRPLRPTNPVAPHPL